MLQRLADSGVRIEVIRPGCARPARRTVAALRGSRRQAACRAYEAPRCTSAMIAIARRASASEYRGPFRATNTCSHEQPDGTTGGEGIEPKSFPGPKPGVFPLDHPPTVSRPRRIRPRREATTPRRPPLYAHAVADAPTALIMAAGRGTRMRSALPKVLHPVCGRPMLHWVIAAAQEAGAARVVCVTRPGDGVAEALPAGVGVGRAGRGRGHRRGGRSPRASSSTAAGTVLTLSGRPPADLRRADRRARRVARAARASAATMLTTEELDPAGLRPGGPRRPTARVERIVETKSTEGVPPEELAIREVNLGTYAFDAEALLDALSTPCPRSAASATSPRSSRSSASAATPSAPTRPRTRPARWASTTAPR